MSGLYVKLDVTYFADDRIVELSPEAQLLYIRALCLCQTLETDGVFTAAQLRSTGAKLGSERDPLRYLRELTATHCGNTEAAPDPHARRTRAARAEVLRRARQATCSAPVEQLNDRNYRITAWLKHNKPAAEIKRIRGERSAAGRKGGLASADERAGHDKQNPSNLLRTCEANAQASETETESTSESTTTTTANPIPADNPQEDDPREAVVVGLLAKRATDKAGKIGTTRERYEKGALKNIVAERGDEIRLLLRNRPSASAETIVDLLERGNSYQAPSTNGVRPQDNPPQLVNNLCPPIVVPDIEPAAAPPPPHLLARARHTEDEQPIEEAVAS